jgi:hypothetical protein
VTVVEQEHRAMTNPTAAAGPPAEPVVRPAPHRWLWYALGGRLPRRNRGWVLFDTTTETWWARHVARTLVQMAIPIALVVTLLPAGGRAGPAESPVPGLPRVRSARCAMRRCTSGTSRPPKARSTWTGGTPG